MPDKMGKLSDEEYATAQEWIRNNAAGQCSCGNNSWLLAQHVVVLRSEAQNLFGEHTVYPSLLMICEKCGHFRLFGARRAGIKSFKDSESAKEAENAK